MRVAPIGLAYDDAETAFVLARDSAVITHGHPSGYLSAAYAASLVSDLSRGRSLDDAMVRADRLLAREEACEEMQEAVAGARACAARGVPSAGALEELGGGWVGEEALAIALACALSLEEGTPDGVKRALWRAACHSGDSDSTAAIAGNLLGAMLGGQALPGDWLEELELAAEIEALAVDLHQAFGRGGAIDPQRYPPA
jgi:ADP-ribosylglycohydrolase